MYETFYDVHYNLSVDAEYFYMMSNILHFRLWLDITGCTVGEIGEEYISFSLMEDNVGTVI